MISYRLRLSSGIRNERIKVLYWLWVYREELARYYVHLLNEQAVVEGPWKGSNLSVSTQIHKIMPKVRKQMSEYQLNWCYLHFFQVFVEVVTHIHTCICLVIQIKTCTISLSVNLKWPRSRTWIWLKMGLFLWVFAFHPQPNCILDHWKFTFFKGEETNKLHLRRNFKNI